MAVSRRCSIFWCARIIAEAGQHELDPIALALMRLGHVGKDKQLHVI
jgi:hypothetical protein